MDDTKKRILGYGSGLVAGAVLVYLGFVHARSMRADVETLVGSATVQVRLAASMSAEARRDLVRQAHQVLDDVEAQQQDHPQAGELRAQLFYLEGKYEDAAAVYAWLQQCKSATPEQRDLFVLNRSRMLRAAGKARSAAEVLDAYSPRFLTENAHKSQIERAYVLVDLGRKGEAVELMVKTAADTEAPMALLEAGLFLERQDKFEMADTAYQRAARKDPLVDYYRARLKVRNAEYDSGLDLLERVLRAAGPRVRTLLRRDREAWSSCASIKRFKDLLEPAGKSARPGR